MKTTTQPLYQEFQIEGVKHIGPQDAYTLIKDKKAVLIDVRESEEVDIDLINMENVLYHPMSVILERLPLIDKDQNIIVMCPGGVRSSKVVNLMNIQGFTNVANLDGGFKLWKSIGLPYDTILPSGDGCNGHCDSCSTGVESSCCK